MNELRLFGIALLLMLVFVGAGNAAVNKPRSSDFSRSIASGEVIAIGTVVAGDLINSDSIRIDGLIDGTLVGAPTLYPIEQKVSGGRRLAVSASVIVPLVRDRMQRLVVGKGEGGADLVFPLYLDKLPIEAVPSTLRASDKMSRVFDFLFQLAQLDPNSLASRYLYELLVSGMVEPNEALGIKLVTLARNPNEIPRRYAIASLLELNDVRGLELALGDVGRRVSHCNESLIVNGIRTMDPSADLVSDQLSRYLDTLGDDCYAVKRAIAFVFARWHTPRTVRELAKHLYDTDLEIVASVIGGMSMFANDVPPGKHTPSSRVWKYRTPDTIRFSLWDADLLGSRRDTYVTFWAEWWARFQQDIALE